MNTMASKKDVNKIELRREILLSVFTQLCESSFINKRGLVNRFLCSYHLFFLSSVFGLLTKQACCFELEW